MCDYTARCPHPCAVVPDSTLATPIRIAAFHPRWRDDFRRLNEDWLRRHFNIEPIDAEVLGDPESMILTEGGEVLFALEGDAVVGTCALMAAGDGEYELTKMAVDESRHGRGIGRRLMQAAIAANVAGMRATR